MKQAFGIATGCVLLLIALGARADDFWKVKPSSQWTAGESVQILQDSPWARQETVAVGPPEGCDPDDYDDNGNCRDSRFRFPGNSKRPGKSKIPDAQFNVAVYLVRWDSAPQVVAAFARLEALGERASAAFRSPPPRRPADRYVITLNVVRPPKGPGDLFALNEDTKERMPVRLKTSRGTFVPLETERSGVGANEALHFFFPREQDGQHILDPAGDSAEFVFEGRKATVKTRFSLSKEMLP